MVFSACRTDSASQFARAAGRLQDLTRGPDDTLAAGTAGHYARGGVRDYCIVDLIDRVLGAYRDPGPDPAAPFAWRYRAVQRLGPAVDVSPLALPAVRIAVRDVLP